MEKCSTKTLIEAVVVDSLAAVVDIRKGLVHRAVPALGNLVVDSKGSL